MNDGMILKFTLQGKFVAEWGGVGPCTTSMDMTRFCQVADMDFDAKPVQVGDKVLRAQG